MNRTVLTLTAVLLLSGAVAAQDMEHRIGGKSVPEEQLGQVQQRCDAMRQGDVASPVAAAASAEQSDAVAADAAAETAVDLAGDLWTEEGKIDTDKLSIELCDEGNFKLETQ